MQAILGFENAAQTPGVRYELIPESGARTGVVLEASACPIVKERLHLIPAPRAFVVSGHLDQIGHGLGRFQLLMGEGRPLHGRLHRGHLDVELLRPLWGKPATVQGIVHFKANGQPRFIEARRISARTQGDRIFETIPIAETGEREDAAVLSKPERLVPTSKASVKAIRHVDPMILWGSWPGDEPIEELLAELD